MVENENFKEVTMKLFYTLFAIACVLALATFIGVTFWDYSWYEHIGEWIKSGIALGWLAIITGMFMFIVVGSIVAKIRKRKGKK